MLNSPMMDLASLAKARNFYQWTDFPVTKSIRLTMLCQYRKVLSETSRMHS